MTPRAQEREAPRMIYRGHLYRLYPTPEQAATLTEWFGTVRAVYNAALEQRRDHWRNFHSQHGKHISFFSQSAEVKHLRAEFDWIAALPCDALNGALRDLDRAYQAFFSGKAKYPSPRKATGREGLRVTGVNARLRRLSARFGTVSLSKLGAIRLRLHRPLRGRCVAVTVSRRAGAWWVSFRCEREAERLPRPAASVGIDLGVATTLALSTGEQICAPDQRHLDATRARAQRTLSRRKRGSKRYLAAKARVARISARQAAARADWCHRASTEIARRFGAVGIEDLNIQAMTATASGSRAEPGRGVRQKAGLNRAILSQSWGRFAEFLDYKLAERGGVLIRVPAKFTSQTCAECGVVDARSRKSQAVFQCVACGHTDNADVYAAREIGRRSTALLDVEAGVVRPSKRQLQVRGHVL